MKNLKNMLFAAAIGAVLVPMVAGAKDITTKTIAASDVKSYSGAYTVKAGNTLTVNSDAGAVFTEHCNDGTTTCDNDKKIAGITVTLEKGAKLVNYSDATPTVNVTGTGLVLYTMKDAGTTYVADSELNLSDTDKATKTVYYEAKEEEITIAAPEILGAYRSVKTCTGCTVKDKKAVISKADAKDGKNATIEFTANDKSDTTETTITYNVNFVKKSNIVLNTVDGKKITENQAAIDAIIADYISVMNNDKANDKKVFGVKGLTVGALDNIAADTQLTFDEDDEAATPAKAAIAKAAIEKVVSGSNLTKINDEITYFTLKANIGDVNITDISSTGKKFTVTVATGLTDVVVPEGKALYVINYHVDNANTAANIVDKNAKLDEKGNLTFTTNQFSTFAVAIGDKVAETPATPAQTTDKDTKETNTGDATKEANPKTSDNVMTSVVSLLVSAFGLTAAGLKLKNN